nr:chemotaxis protein CheB [Kovacikia minuta]
MRYAVANSTLRNHGAIPKYVGTKAAGLIGMVLGALPPNLDATLFIVQHLAADKPSLLPQILGDAAALPATHPSDREPFNQRESTLRRPTITC